MTDKRVVIACLEPVGRRVEIESDCTLLEAIQEAGVQISAVCGGDGICGKCLVRLLSGKVSPLSKLERSFLSESDIGSGYRLACRTTIQSDVTVYIPPESLSAGQRLQTEGADLDLELDPVITLADLVVDRPTIHDLRSDGNRFQDACRREAVEGSFVGFPLIRSLSPVLREQDWKVRVASDGTEVVAILSKSASAIGLAVDIGTTKLASYLVDLEDGQIMARLGKVNPQVAFGDDVVNRIAFANREENGQDTLQKKLVDAINEMIGELCDSAGVIRDEILEAVVVGNTAMHHMFAGLPVKQLGEAPYVPAVGDPMRIRSSELGLQLAAGSYTYLPPNVAGYVGADHVAMVLATEIANRDETAIAIDIGTNTEVSLVADGRLLTCSCASGPAFEGAHIQFGMRAIPGAIERVEISNGKVFVQTIDGRRPVGICGSGILDAVAQMHRQGIIDSSGRLNQGCEGVETDRYGGSFRLVAAEDSGNDRAVILTRKDINEIQLAKAAIRTGIEILLQEAGRCADEIESFVIAGAFGTYLDVESARHIRMFPDLPLERFKQVGNAAGIGARRMLVSKSARLEAERIRENIEYVELTVHPNFFDVYATELMF